MVFNNLHTSYLFERLFQKDKRKTTYMIRDIIIEKTYLAFLILFTIFILIKFYGLVYYKIKKGRTLVFIFSMKIFSKQEIRNTFDRRKPYYIFSNKVNLVFYILFLLVFGAWLFINLL